MDRLITTIHAMVSLALRASGMDNLHASTFRKTFLSFKSYINCSSLSLKTLVTMSGQSYAANLRVDRGLSKEEEFGLAGLNMDGPIT